MKKLAGFLSRVILGAIIIALVIVVIAGIAGSNTVRIALAGLILVALSWFFGDAFIMAWKDF